MVGTIEIITGVAVFSTISGYLANAFVSSRKKDEEKPEGEDTAGPAALLAEVKRLGDAQEQRAIELEARLARMETLLVVQAPVSGADGTARLRRGVWESPGLPEWKIGQEPAIILMRGNS